MGGRPAARKHQAVVGVGPGHQQRQRQPGAVSGQVQLGPGLGAVDRGAGQVPRTARRLKLSALSRDQSSASGCAELVRQQLLEPLEHPGVGPLGIPPPAGRHAAAAELAHRQQRPGSRGARHEQDRGHAGPVGHGAGRATACPGRWGQQGLDPLPQLVGQQAVGQGGHERGSSHYRTTRPIASPEVPECPVSCQASAAGTAHNTDARTARTS